MDFRRAVERLNECTTREELADALGVSFWTVKQALLPAESAGHRSPPSGWRAVLAQVARARARRFDALAEQLERGGRE